LAKTPIYTSAARSAVTAAATRNVTAIEAERERFCINDAA